MMLLSREALFVATTSDCWSTGASTLAALVHIMVNLKPWQVGLFPAFRYSLSDDEGIAPAFVRTDLLPQKLLKQYEMELYEPINLASAFLPHHSPFSRGTIAYQFSRQELSELVLKRQAVAHDRRYRESKVWAAIEEKQSLLSPKTMDCLSAVLGSVELCRSHNSDVQPLDQRQYTLIICRNPRPALPQPLTRHPSPTPSQLLCIIKDAFNVLTELKQVAGVLHCDISSSNILHNDGRLVLIDWDCAVVASLSNSKLVGNRSERTGTIDTMAVNVLEAVETYRVLKKCGRSEVEAEAGFVHHLRHDYESLIYVLLKVFWANLKPSADALEIATVWDPLYFDNADATVQLLLDCRSGLWGGGRRGFKTVECLRKLSPALADLYQSLLSEPFDDFGRFSASEAQDVQVKTRVDKAFQDVRWAEIETAELMARWAKASVTTIPVPLPGKGQVLIQVEAVGLNAIDIKAQIARFGGFVVGCDFAGKIIELGSGVQGVRDQAGREWRVNDRVAGMVYTCSSSANGAFAEYVVSNVDTLIKLPGNVTTEQGAPLPLSYLTAVLSIEQKLLGYAAENGLDEQSPASRDASSVRIPADCVCNQILIYSASTGLGQSAIQFIRMLSSTRPIITLSSPSSFDLLKSYGATLTLSYKSTDADLLKDLAQHGFAKDSTKPIKLALDCYSEGDSSTRCQTLMAPGGGRIVRTLPAPMFSKPKPGFVVDWVYVFTTLNQPLRLLVFTWPPKPADQTLAAQRLRDLEDALASGSFKPLPYSSVSGGLEGLNGALNKIKSGSVAGKKLVARL
ncbi:hypothetical protein OIV83_005979 [Microbotryomycetes sp. JL201]|nr:hypothetical protein OIV83_005979 [Microbotryomycetes sp. JL201]